MHDFVVHSNESVCRKSGRLGLEQVNDGCLKYIFTEELLNGTPNIFTNSQYHCWFK